MSYTDGDSLSNVTRRRRSDGEHHALFFPREDFPRGGGDVENAGRTGGHPDRIVENDLGGGERRGCGKGV